MMFDVSCELLSNRGWETQPCSLEVTTKSNDVVWPGRVEISRDGSNVSLLESGLREFASDMGVEHINHDINHVIALERTSGIRECRLKSRIVAIKRQVVIHRALVL